MFSHHRSLVVLLVLLMPVAWTADTTTPPPAAAAAPAAPATKVAFGIITLASDKHSFTIADAKGGMITLTITDQTTITRDQDNVTLAKLVLDQQVRVTYRDDVALSIDQLSPGKKKKKKTV